MSVMEEKEFPTLEDMTGEELDEFMRSVRLTRIARPEKAKEPKEKKPKAGPKVKAPRPAMTVERTMELTGCTREEAEQVFADAAAEKEQKSE